MRTTENTEALIEALAAAQGELENPVAEQIAKIGVGGLSTYNYADLANVLNATRKVLSKHKIAILQVPVMKDGMMVCTTRIALGAQWIETDYPVCQIGADHKAMGAALTYAKRQSLSSMVAVAAERDTDGEGAASPQQEERDPPWVTKMMTEITVMDDFAQCDPWWKKNVATLRGYKKKGGAEDTHADAVIRHFKGRHAALKPPEPTLDEPAGPTETQEAAPEASPFDDEIPFR